MTPPWHDQLLAYVDDAYDRENASDGHSRYGAYLRQRPTDFHDGRTDEPAPVQDAADFAARAWRIATAPVMAPGYVRIRPDLHRITLHRDDVDGHLYADVHTPLRHDRLSAGAGRSRIPYTWQDWETEQDYGDGGYERQLEPRSNKEPSVLASAVVRVPGRDWTGLVAPTAYEGRTLLDEAREAVQVVAQHINDDAGPMVARLLG